MKEPILSVEKPQNGTNGHVSVQTPRNRAGQADSVQTTHPSISIIVPALNEEKLIERTLHCFPADIRHQINMELIVSDGGSSDQTVQIAREYADKVVVHEEDRKQTIAEGRNCGANVATGDLLVFINADTIPCNTQRFLAALTAMASGDPNSGPVAIACPVEIAPGERRFSDRLFHNFFNNYVRLLNRVGFGMGRGECQVVWRTHFTAVNGYQNHMAAGEDFDLYTRLSRKGGIGHSRELMVYESPRRFRRFGYLRILFEWTLNALSVILRGRSMSKEWEEVR